MVFLIKHSPDKDRKRKMGKMEKASSYIQLICSYIVCAVMTMLFLNSFQPALGQNFQQVHDPSDPVFHNGRWYIYTTGAGIYAMSKTSLTPTTGWRTETRVFPSGYPDWIKSYVPNFDGHFWAPHLMTNRVYYSCSTFGSKVSAIGMAEGPPGGPYTDKGMVVFSNNSTNQGNAIDPFVFEDYLIYGSWFNGIFMVRLGADGKPATNERTKIIDGGARDAEAAFMTKHGEYYYLWFNRGKCCDGLNSTYYIQVGRSTSITGPFRDRNNNLLTNGGGTTVVSSSGRYTGPGGSGISGNTLVWHFYDGNANGNPRLMTGLIGYIDGWPCVTPAYGDGGNRCSFTAPSVTQVKSGQSYRITPAHSLSKTFDVASCGSTNNTNVRMWDWLNNDCQKWKFVYWGNENWIIYPNHATDKMLNVADTSMNNGANINLWTFANGAEHQQWQLVPQGLNHYMIKNRNSGKCLEIEGASTINGANLVQQECNELLPNQVFYILSPDLQPTSASTYQFDQDGSLELKLFPNPVVSGSFMVSGTGIEGQAVVKLLDLNGRAVMQKTVPDASNFKVETQTQAGIYLLKIQSNTKSLSGKVVIR